MLTSGFLVILYHSALGEKPPSLLKGNETFSFHQKPHLSPSHPSCLLSLHQNTLLIFFSPTFNLSLFLALRPFSLLQPIRPSNSHSPLPRFLTPFTSSFTNHSLFFPFLIRSTIPPVLSHSFISPPHPLFIHSLFVPFTVIPLHTLSRPSHWSSYRTPSCPTPLPVLSHFHEIPNVITQPFHSPPLIFLSSDVKPSLIL